MRAVESLDGSVFALQSGLCSVAGAPPSADLHIDIQNLESRTQISNLSVVTFARSGPTNGSSAQKEGFRSFLAPTR